MRIFLAGATGFIGSHTLRALTARGHQVTCLVRRSGRSSAEWEHVTRRLAAIPGTQVAVGDWTNAATWCDAVAGHDAVVNAVGIIRETRRARFDVVQTSAPIALFEAAAKAAACKIVQLSALGADTGARSAFHRSKRAADEHLARLGVPYVVLRPSFVYGPGDHSMAFFARLARWPLAPVPGDGRTLLQPVYVADLVSAIVQAVERDDLAAQVVDVGGAQVLTFAALLDCLARAEGKTRGARKLHIAWPLVALAAAGTDLLGGHGPITRDELGMLRRAMPVDLAPFVALFGFVPRPFSEGVLLRRDAVECRAEAQ
ncbi:MAG TPA: NAD-dependent epimerase/dehydratase family protein [Ktedonobacterales bacterium]|nr:NAD-dependent epimerase/dehydratase family protein [Ktedonobacterales bacterium]